MKKTTLFFAIWIISFNAISQNYNKLIQQNKYWDIYCYNGFFFQYIDKIYFPGTDTLIEGHNYFLSEAYSYAQINPGNFIPPFVIDTVPYPFGLYLREDTIEKKVYIYDDYLTPSDQLMYDFSLNVGDTLMSDFNTDMVGNRIVLQSIDSVILNNGELRKRFNFQDPVSGIEGNYIEGIGGSMGIYLPILPPFEPDYSFGYFCVSEDDIDLWGDECNWYFVGTANFPEQTKIKIYPNPTTQEVIVELPNQTSDYLFNLHATTGKMIKSIRLNSSKCEVNLEGIIPGVYIVQIVSESNIYNGKLAIFN